MSLRSCVVLMGAALTTLACFSMAPNAIAQSLGEQTDAQSMSQSQLEEVPAKVVAVSNDGDVRVRLPNGAYRVLTNINPDVRAKLNPGDEVIVTTINNNVVNVALATDDTQPVVAEETVETETMQAQEEMVEEQTVESVQTETVTETIVEREVTQTTQTPVVRQPVTPAPVVRPAAQPVRALW